MSKIKSERIECSSKVCSNIPIKNTGNVNAKLIFKIVINLFNSSFLVKESKSGESPAILAVNPNWLNF